MSYAFKEKAIGFGCQPEEVARDPYYLLTDFLLTISFASLAKDIHSITDTDASEFRKLANMQKSFLNKNISNVTSTNSYRE